MRRTGEPLTQGHAGSFYRLKLDTFIPYQRVGLLAMMMGVPETSPVVDARAPTDKVAFGMAGEEALLCIECAMPALSLIEKINERSEDDGT